MPDYNQLAGGTGQLGSLSDPYNILGMSNGTAQRNQLSSNIGNMSQFGGQLGNSYMGNQAGINNTAAGMQGTIGMLQGLATGENSVSAEQLRQGMQQSQAQQMSMAASAAPQNQAMAARTAMMNAGGAASGMMGQQAVAGLQERNQAVGQLTNAQQALGQLQTTQAGQNLQGTLGAYNGATQATGTYLQNQAPSWWQQMIKPAANGLASGLGFL